MDEGTDNSNFTVEFIDEVDNFVVIRLTTITVPFFTGQVVRLNINRIVAFG